jgi:hypothetical protein
LQPFKELHNPMRFKPPHCKRLQGAPDERRRARKRIFVLQVPDNKADAVPCDRLPNFHHAADIGTISDDIVILNRTHCRQVFLDVPVPKTRLPGVIHEILTIVENFRPPAGRDSGNRTFEPLPVLALTMP